MDPVQMRFMRLLSMRTTQTITYHCYNSRAWEEDSDRSIKLQGENEMELTSSEKTKPNVITNNCDVSSAECHVWKIIKNWSLDNVACEQAHLLFG